MIIKKLLNYRNNPIAISRLNVKIILFISFFVIYFVTEINTLSSQNLVEYPHDSYEPYGEVIRYTFGGGWKYPFGADVPAYTFGTGTGRHHPLMMLLMASYRYLVDNLLHIELSTTVAKLPFSFFGAINIVIVHSIFSMFFNRYKSLLFTACYGFSLSVWYFSSVPESYGISVTLYSLYFWYFIKHCSDLRLTKVLILLGILTIAIWNDISSVFLLLIPLMYFNKKIIIDNKIQNYFFLHVCFLVACWHYLYEHVGWHVIKFFFVQRERAGYDLSSYVLSDFIGPLLNVIFFSIGAPSHILSYTPDIVRYIPAYFQPSLLGYMGHIVTAIFFIFYSGLIIVAFSHVQQIKHNAFIIPFITFIAVRYLSIIWYNPDEAFLFTVLSTLPLLLTLFWLFDTVRFKYKGAFELVLLLSIFATNLRFLIQ